MRIEMPEPVLLRTQIYLNSPKHRIQCAASVRHCRRLGIKYVVGVEFTQGVRWKPSSRA